MGKKTIAYGWESGFVVALLGKQTPRAEDWTAYGTFVVEMLKQNRLRGSLVLTDGGGPNASMRAETVRLLNGLKVPLTAIVSSSGLARGIATALSWMRSDASISVFKPGELTDALKFLDVAVADHPKLVATAESLAAMLDEPVTQLWR